MVLVSAVCTASFLAFLAFSREQPMATPPEASAHFMGSMRSVIRIRNIQVLMALFFIGVGGVFSSLAQWIETIMAGRGGISPLDGGITGAIMLVAGISGMVAVPVVAEKWGGSLRKFVIANSLFSALFLFALSFRMPAGYYFVVSFAEGFFLISLAPPLGLQISLESAGEENAGTAAGSSGSSHRSARSSS
ncbi:MFS transporter [Thermogymnomonas acidicola]|uniref:MFS transporter n=1 Tax=Thermogymnomonas acidicola TaxID=399579 RepID=UPI001396A8DA|nr:MFS transporter [Thermogymnomonas acidicola]